MKKVTCLRKLEFSNSFSRSFFFVSSILLSKASSLCFVSVIISILSSCFRSDDVASERERSKSRFRAWKKVEKFKPKSNLSLYLQYYPKACNTARLRGLCSRHCARKTQLLSKTCRSGGEPLAILCPMRLARDLNFRPPTPETNALPLDELVDKWKKSSCKSLK